MNNNQKLTLSIIATFVITVVAGLIVEYFKANYLQDQK